MARRKIYILSSRRTYGSTSCQVRVRRALCFSPSTARRVTQDTIPSLPDVLFRVPRVRSSSAAAARRYVGTCLLAAPFSRLNGARSREKLLYFVFIFSLAPLTSSPLARVKDALVKKAPQYMIRVIAFGFPLNYGSLPLS